MMNQIRETPEELDKNLNVGFFSLYNEIHLARVVECYNGHTLHCIFKHGNKYSKFKIRLRLKNYNGIETSNDLLSSLVLNRNIYLYCHKSDDSGLILGTIKLNINDTTSVNDIIYQFSCSLGSVKSVKKNTVDSPSNGGEDVVKHEVQAEPNENITKRKRPKKKKENISGPDRTQSNVRPLNAPQSFSSIVRSSPPSPTNKRINPRPVATTKTVPKSSPKPVSKTVLKLPPKPVLETMTKLSQKPTPRPVLESSSIVVPDVPRDKFDSLINPNIQFTTDSSNPNSTNNNSKINSKKKSKGNEMAEVELLAQSIADPTVKAVPTTYQGPTKENTNKTGNYFKSRGRTPLSTINKFDPQIETQNKNSDNNPQIYKPVETKSINHNPRVNKKRKENGARM